MQEIYLDNAASTPIDSRVLNSYIDASLTLFGNPSNVKHLHGKAAKAALETARAKIGQCLGLDPRGIIFTSGATEANNLALRGITCLQNKKCSALISSIEHACVDESAKFLLKRGIDVKAVPTRPNGQIDIEALAKMIKKSRKLKLISTLLVNNETGVIQPLQQIIELAKKEGDRTGSRVLVHTDAVQAIGKVSPKILKHADLVSISGHKINGPKGIGFLWVKPGLKISPILVGGGQEQGIRSGTTPLPLIVAFAKAVEIATKDTKWLGPVDKAMRQLERRVVAEIPGTTINGGGAPRVPNISNLSFSLQEQLIDHLPGLAVSSGAACSCPKPQPSKVLLSMGVDDARAKNCLRISASRNTTPQEIQRAANIIIATAKKLS
jgi:cysteine desulfurase